MKTHAEPTPGTATALRTLYLEPTTRCNLQCRACVRAAWNLPRGDMAPATFERVLAGIEAAGREVRLVLAGFGEPLAHPQTHTWVGRAAQAGHRVDLVTNGALLTAGLARALGQAGLGTLWVSLDGARSTAYAEARQGTNLLGVVEKLKMFRREAPYTVLGIAFVATQRNLNELPAVASLAEELGATALHVSHVQAHSAELARDALYPEAMGLHAPTWHNPLTEATCGYPKLTLSGALGAPQRDTCPFGERDALAVRWDGELAPCPELLHPHGSFLCGAVRRVRPFLLGSVEEASLPEVLASEALHSLRQRLNAFDFAPCTRCGACPLYLDNASDCLDSTFPSCGGCLWAQGLIRCP